MANLLVVFLLLHSSVLLADTSDSWRQKVLQSVGLNIRVTFGVSDINESESEAIQVARIIARTEMAKSFKFKITSYVALENNYQQTHEKTESRKINYLTSTHESTEEIELVGLDLSNFEINHENKTVQVAAILNLKLFEMYLVNKTRNLLNIVNTTNGLLKCKSVDDLKKFRNRLNNLTEAIKYEELLKTFSEKDLKAEKRLYDETTLVKSCRSKFSIFVKESSEIKNFIRSEGFSINNSPAQLKISINKELLMPEIKFGRINIVGKVKVILTNEDGREFVWAGRTLRQSDLGAESTSRKLDIRLEDEAYKGVQALLEENM